MSQGVKDATLGLKMKRFPDIEMFSAVPNIVLQDTAVNI